MSSADLLLNYVRNGLDPARPWDHYSAYGYASDLVMEIRIGVQPDWRNILTQLAALGNARVNAMLAGLPGDDELALAAGRRAYLAGYAAHLREFRRREYERAVAWMQRNESEELDAPLGLGYTGLGGGEMREWRGVS